VTNTGNVTLHNAAVHETNFTGNGPAPVPGCPTSTLAPGQQMTCTSQYHLTQSDIDGGSITNTAHATGEPPSGPEVVATASSVTIPEDAAPALTLVKSVEPATVTAAGQPVTYTFLVTNTGNVTLKGVAVKEGSFSGTGNAPVPSCPAGTTSLLPGAQLSCTATYTATQRDIDAGSVTNTATASATPPTGAALTSPPSTATVVAPGDAAIRVVKSASPAEATAFNAGQGIAYTYVVTNTGNVTLDAVTVQETTFTGTGPAPAPKCAATRLAPGAQTVCTSSYSLTQADVDAGSLTNVATAAGDPPTGHRVVSIASSVTIPQTPHPALTVLKRAKPEKVTAAGQPVSYTFVVTNTGNVSLTGIAVTEDSFSGTGGIPVPSCPATATPVPPGMEITCTATYSATDADVNAGMITNTASATASPPSRPPIGSRPSTASVAGVRGSTDTIVEGGSTGRPAPPSGTLPRTGSGIFDMLRTALTLLAVGIGLLRTSSRTPPGGSPSRP